MRCIVLTPLLIVQSIQLCLTTGAVAAAAAATALTEVNYTVQCAVNLDFCVFGGARTDWTVSVYRLGTSKALSR